MGAFLAVMIGIIVFVMLVNSREGIKENQKDDNGDSEKQSGSSINLVVLGTLLIHTTQKKRNSA